METYVLMQPMTLRLQLNINNKTGQVPLNKDNPTEDSLNVSAAPTRIGLDIARQTDLGELTGKIEADFGVMAHQTVMENFVSVMLTRR